MSVLLLVDGSNYLFRAFHALPPLATSHGEPTGAIKGFNGMLKNVCDIVKPDYAACVFDAKGKNFRHDMYPEYKANRPPMPEELRVQIEPIFEMVKLKGWPLLQVDGVEADDVLATLAKRAQALGMKVVIATGDKDLAQLVDDDITLINTMSKTRYDRQGVFDKYGVWPEQIIDYLSLMGDKVDNVPGINKCGPKTAAKWIAQYGSLDGVIAHAEEVTGKIGEYLREGIPFLDVAKRLVTINCNVAIDTPVEKLVIAPENSEKLTQFYVRWEMRTAAKTKAVKQTVSLAESAGAPTKKQIPAQADLFDLGTIPNEAQGQTLADVAFKTDVRLAVTAEELKALALELKGYETAVNPVAVDLLVDIVHPMHDVATGLAFALTPLKTVYVPLRHENGQNAKIADVRETLKDWFESSAPKLFQDAKYALHVLANDGIDVKGVVHDTMLMSYVLEAHLKHDLGRIAARSISTVIYDSETLLGKGASRVLAKTTTVADAAAFLTRRAAALRACASVLLTRLALDESLAKIYREVELPVMHVLTKMERLGVLLDVDKLHAQSAELGERIDGLMDKIYEIAGEKFNPASPKQLAQILFEKLALPVKKKTASGTPSTDEEVLSELALDYPLPKLILEYRSLAKLKSTYTDKLPQMVDERDHRVHTTFGQATAVTGRLASSDPNLQNIPVRTLEGRRIRETFVAPEGCQIVSADYSQIELRIMAHISGDPGLIDAFMHGKDIHRATAAEVFGVDLDQVTPDQRRMAKVINFGLIYGMSAFGLAQNLGVARGVASSYIEQYFARYPKVQAYMTNTRALAHAQGYVETAFGRRLWLPDIQSSRAPVRAAAERAAINAPMQGTAADLIKLAMVAVQNWLEESRLKSRMILQVHDELILEVPRDEVDVVRQKLPALMAGVAKLSVPLIAEVGVADNWEAAH